MTSLDAGHRLPSRAVWLEYLAVVLLGWRFLIGMTLLSAALAFVATWLLPPSYTAVSTFVPAPGSGANLPSGLGTLANQFGVALPAGDAGSSPEFYVRLVRSREILDSLLLGRYATRRGDSIALTDHLGIAEKSTRAMLDEAALKFRDHLQASADRQTNIVRVEIDDHDPVVAADLTNRLVDLLNRFNLEKRKTQAGERRAFVERRLHAAEEDLRAAEDAQGNFLAENRTFTVPRLQFENARLERRVQVRQEVYLTLQREFELARIQEVNDTPVISIIDRAVTPTDASGPRRLRIAAAAGVLAGFLGLGILFFRAYVAGLRSTGDSGWSRLREAWRASRPGWLRSPRASAASES